MVNKELIEAIKELNSLKESKILTQEEFEREKNEILAYNTKGLKWLSTITNFLKVGIWPFIALFIVLSFYNPLKERLSKSTEVGVGSFYLKVQDTAKITGNKELANILKGLSKDALQRMLELGRNSHRLIISDDKESTYHLPENINIYKELEKNGLLTSTESLEAFIDKFISLKGEYQNYNCDGKEGKIYGVKKSSIQPDDIEKIEKFTVRLNSNGTKAFNIILESVSSEISSK